MKLIIELKSDLCSASGETYNSLVDTDVVYDEYGLPYIPAKRIKGCIREAALEMLEMSSEANEYITEKEFCDIFGTGQASSSEAEKNQRSGFSLSNAYIRDYDAAIASLENLKNSKAAALATPQNVLSLFTYTRTQTAVDLETGVADENSLRTIRVVRRGTIFEADLTIANPAHEKVLCQAISLVKHMGVARSRGFGLVKLYADEVPHGETGVSTSSEAINAGTDQRNSLPGHVTAERAAITEHNKLRYRIFLKSAMICKSACGNQTVTEDYIAGSRVLGIIAGAVGSKKYQELTDQTDEFVVTNAYITADGERCLPGRISLQKQKDQPWDENGQMEIKDMLYEESIRAAKGLQMTPAGIDYMNSFGKKVSVETEISYHHQRPENKATGHATGEDGSSFYQLCSISRGQTFTGYIYANRKQTETILDAFEKMGEVRMGYGRSSEFGAVELVIDKIEPCSEKGSAANGDAAVHDAVITLISDVILYDQNGAFTTDINDLLLYIRQASGIEDLRLADVNPYLKFVTVGGFNVTWKARKPIFRALGKGSTFAVKSDMGIDISAMQNLFIGERVGEGFGEIAITPPGNATVTIRKSGMKNNPEARNLEDDSLIVRNILVSEFERRMQGYVVAKVKEGKRLYREAGIKAALAKIRIIYKDAPDYAEMQKQIKALERDDKNKLCTELIELLDPDDVKGREHKAAENPEEVKKDIPEKISEKLLGEMKADYGMPDTLVNDVRMYYGTQGMPADNGSKKENTPEDVKKRSADVFYRKLYRAYIAELKYAVKIAESAGKAAEGGKEKPDDRN